MRFGEPSVACSGEAAILLADHSDVIGERIEHRDGLRIAGAIIDDHDFKVLKGLRPQTVERARQIGVRVVARQDNADGGVGD